MTPHTKIFNYDRPGDRVDKIINYIDKQVDTISNLEQIKRGHVYARSLQYLRMIKGMDYLVVHLKMTYSKPNTG